MVHKSCDHMRGAPGRRSLDDNPRVRVLVPIEPAAEVEHELDCELALEVGVSLWQKLHNKDIADFRHVLCTLLPRVLAFVFFVAQPLVFQQDIPPVLIHALAHQLNKYRQRLVESSMHLARYLY